MEANDEFVDCCGAIPGKDEEFKDIVMKQACFVETGFLVEFLEQLGQTFRRREHLHGQRLGNNLGVCRETADYCRRLLSLVNRCHDIPQADILAVLLIVAVPIKGGRSPIGEVKGIA